MTHFARNRASRRAHPRREPLRRLDRSGRNPDVPDRLPDTFPSYAALPRRKKGRRWTSSAPSLGHRVEGLRPRGLVVTTRYFHDVAERSDNAMRGRVGYQAVGRDLSTSVGVRFGS